MTSRSAGRTTREKPALDPIGDATSEQTVSYRPLQSLKAYPSNARLHSRKQVRQIADSIERFGFTNPVLIDDDGMILAGHGRVEAAKLLGHENVPCLRLSSMSQADKRAYVLADNKLALNAGWDEDILRSELQLLLDCGEIDLSLTGFTIAEIDGLLDPGGTDGATEAEDDRLPPIPDDAVAITRAGDLWQLGPHRLICGDARDDAVYRRLMRRTGIDGNVEEGGDGPEGAETMHGTNPLAAPGGFDDDVLERAQLVFTDPPYNVPIQGHVGGSGATKHREFAMASGEMDRDGFTEFLSTVFERLVQHTVDGSIHLISMDWRHMDEILTAGRAHYTELKNLIVWVKDNGGMGTFYRSRHELIFAFKSGNAPHINSFELGQHGRYRTNVWNYRGMSSPSRASRQELALHPTVKPVAMLADAMRDCAARGGLVLDAFCGSGSVLLAAHKTGRRARAIEIDPVYCDTAIRRWQAFAKDDAVLVTTGETFDEVAARRAEETKAALATDLPVQNGPEADIWSGAAEASGINRAITRSRAPERRVLAQGQSPWAKAADPERGDLRR